jgi:hypothetical protein
MSFTDPQILRRVASFLFAAETAALQNTCKNILQRPMPYCFENLKSIATVVQLRLANRIQSVTVEDGKALTYVDLTTAVLIGQQIPVQIQRISITHFGSPDLDIFLQSTSAKNVTIYADHVTYIVEMAVVCRLLQFPHVGRIFVSHNVLLSLKHHDVDDPRLRLRKLQILDALGNENVPFFLSRLDDDVYSNAVQFLSSSSFVFVTARQIIDFCNVVISNFSSQPQRLFFGISAEVDTTDENHLTAMNAMDEMMELLSPSKSAIILHARNSVIRKWR